MSFLYQISTQNDEVEAAQSLLQLNQSYYLSSQGSQLLLFSSIAIADLAPLEQDHVDQCIILPDCKANTNVNTNANANTRSTKPILRLFGHPLNWPLLQQVLNIVVVDAQFLSLRSLKPHADLGCAIELELTSTLSDSQQQQLAELTTRHNVEQLYLLTRPILNQPGLLVMDMDSTAIQIECIDEIAKLAGVGEQVAKVTAQAMNGELDFGQSLMARVATLQGADSAILAQVLHSMPVMPGLAELVNHLQQHHWHIAIASGGFTYFTHALQQRFNLTATFANQLEIIEGKLTGKIIGDIVDAQSKANVVQQLTEQYKLAAEQTIAIGDGANDIPMLKTAHYGVAFHAKAAVQAQAQFVIKQGSLLQLLYLFDS